MVARKHGAATIPITLVLILLAAACSKDSQAPLKFSRGSTGKAEPAHPSTINVEVKGGGPAVLTTSGAEFQVRPDGYIQAFLLKDGKKLSLDEPNVGAPADSDFVRAGGKDVHFTLDFQAAKVLEAIGKMGVGERIEIPARPLGPSGTELQRVLALEVYDNFPNILLSTVEYKNTGAQDVVIEKSVNQRRRLNARLSDAQVHPWEMWSFHGSSYDWGKDDVVKLTRAFSQPNVFGEMVKGGYGGG
ncbi:MAG TPA: hypothetical protein VGO27_03795, partial [Candidatus Acidoferrum sp.]|nr:hypothetical protein [Candidatus Acidoferrum sp.]